jgi:hypothetical protein
MDTTHVREPAPAAGAEKRRTVARPLSQLPAGPDYWPVPSQPTAARRRATKHAPARELTPEPAP